MWFVVMVVVVTLVSIGEWRRAAAEPRWRRWGVVAFSVVIVVTGLVYLLNGETPPPE